jgi:hypothetical protein
MKLLESTTKPPYPAGKDLVCFLFDNRSFKVLDRVRLNTSFRRYPEYFRVFHQLQSIRPSAHAVGSKKVDCPTMSPMQEVPNIKSTVKPACPNCA